MERDKTSKVKKSYSYRLSRASSQSCVALLTAPSKSVHLLQTPGTRCKACLAQRGAQALSKSRRKSQQAFTICRNYMNGWPGY
eukprot:3567042-Rhodomonas_salina.2